ncbi:MAG: CHC2 zinc finger domain-containing protein [bacterium]
MIKEEDKEFYKLLFPEIKYCSDNDLESWRVFVMRELVEAKLGKVEKWQIDQLRAWQKVLDEERDRRVELTKHGVPYKGENRIAPGQVEALKRYYTGDMFVSLFVKITAFQVFPGSNGNMKYRCTLHGEDKNPSGVLYLNEGRYYCFGGCGGGDIFQLLYAFEPHSTFVEAVKHLTKWSSLPEYTQTEDGKWKRL